MMERKTTAEKILNELKRDLAEWMEAKEDMVWRPPLELAKERDEFVARTLVPGFDPNSIEILISPDAILVKGETDRGEPGHRRLMRSIPFPRPINPDRVHAEMKDGMLSVRAEIAHGSKVLEFVPRAA
jgi:HSP20 family molecular chaperone IbpA